MTRPVSLGKWLLQKKGKQLASNIIWMKIKFLGKNSMTGFTQYVQTCWMMKPVMS